VLGPAAVSRASAATTATAGVPRALWAHHPESAARLAPWVRFARVTAVAASNLSRLLRRGDGGVIGGTVALRMAPDILTRLGRGRVLACVSGTNGKTTATRLSAMALGTRLPVISNSSGANLTAGLVTTLCRHRTGRAVLEVDEMYLAGVVRSVQPRVVVLLNLSRDQLDRTAEPHRIAASWRAALCDARSCIVVANCDDPRVTWAAAGAANVVWVSAGQSWTGDSYVCPACGDVLHRGIAGTHVTWHCPRCGLARPDPDAALTGRRLTLRGVGSWRVTLSLPGRANRANAAMAAVAAHVLGVPVHEALSSMRDIDAVEGRYGVHTIDGVACRLILAKNPAGWAETIDLVGENDRPLVLAVNARPVDGLDTSWLYDVPFERLAGRRLWVTGAAAVDLSLRLSYGRVPHRLVRDVSAAVRDWSTHRAIPAPPEGAAPVDVTPAGCIDVIADYSNFRQLRSHPQITGRPSTDRTAISPRTIAVRSTSVARGPRPGRAL